METDETTEPRLANLLAQVEPAPRQRYRALARVVGTWPDVEEGAYYHVGEWSPVLSVRGQQLLHVHFHKPHLISVSLSIGGTLGEAALAAPGVTQRMRERIRREWSAGEAYVEFRINSEEDLRSIEAAARAMHEHLLATAAGPAAS